RTQSWHVRAVSSWSRDGGWDGIFANRAPPSSSISAGGDFSALLVQVIQHRGFAGSFGGRSSGLECLLATVCLERQTACRVCQVGQVADLAEMRKLPGIRRGCQVSQVSQL